MTKRRDIEEHVRALGEIEGIMGAMKNLALMETRKLSRILPAQLRVVADIEAAGGEFLSCYPSVSIESTGHELYVVIGAERGFCGDFNGRLLSSLDRHLATRKVNDPVLIVVGQKLLQRAEQRKRTVSFVEGPTVADEVPSVLMRVVDRLRKFAVRDDGRARPSVTTVYHDAVANKIVIRPLRPFQQSDFPSSNHASRPLLTLAPEIFFDQLLDLYLFSLLHAIFYDALLAESRARLAHLDSALQRLERDRTDLLRKRNIIRQDEITEEIEVLMLSNHAKSPQR